MPRVIAEDPLAKPSRTQAADICLRRNGRLEERAHRHAPRVLAQLFLEDNGQPNAHLARAWNREGESERTSVARADAVGIRGAPSERIEQLARARKVKGNLA